MTISGRDLLWALGVFFAWVMVVALVSLFDENSGKK